MLRRNFNQIVARLTVLQEGLTQMAIDQQAQYQALKEQLDSMQMSIRAIGTGVQGVSDRIQTLLTQIGQQAPADLQPLVDEATQENELLQQTAQTLQSLATPPASTPPTS